MYKLIEPIEPIESMEFGEELQPANYTRARMLPKEGVIWFRVIDLMTALFSIQTDPMTWPCDCYHENPICAGPRYIVNGT
jgi:hypothetical protein